MFLILFFCWFLHRKNRETKKEEYQDFRQLPSPEGVTVGGILWAFFSSSWMWWNEEARVFMGRKFSHFKNHWLKPKCEVTLVKSLSSYCPNTRHSNITREGVSCRECDQESECPNCIVKQVLERRRGRHMETDPRRDGAVSIPYM